MWTYSQLRGALSHDGEMIGNGYSGHASGMNNPDAEAEIGVGPIPRGLWAIDPFEEFHPHLGPWVAHLTPNGFDPHGRSGFFIHGDNAAMDHSASDGCIILSRDLRDQIRDSGDTGLTVTA